MMSMATVTVTWIWTLAHSASTGDPWRKDHTQIRLLSSQLKQVGRQAGWAGRRAGR